MKLTRHGSTVLSIVALILFSISTSAQVKTYEVERFEKIIISPHIEVTFIEGSTESVEILSSTESIEKLNVEVKKNTLHIYLDDAKITTATEKENINGTMQKVPIYKGTVVRAVVTYKNLNSLDLRGEEKFVFEGSINMDKLKLNIYGESQVTINEIFIKSLNVSLYGESYLEILSGKTQKQKITAYGESKVNASTVENTETKLTAYGDGTFQLNVTEELKVTSYGEATIIYSGDARLKKGLIIGDTEIKKINF